VIYAAYFDESDDKDHAFGVGGFLGSQLDCVHLEWAWKEKILDKYDLEYFKASELAHGTGQFRKFRDDPSNIRASLSEREKALFTEIKTKTVDVFLDAEFLIGFGAYVVIPDYKRLLAELRAEGLVLPKPYWFGAQIVYMEAGRIMNDLNYGVPESQSSHVSPIYDFQDEYMPSAQQIFEDYRDKNPLWSKWILPPHYEDDKDYVVLQVADNLAYEMRKLVIKDAFNEARPERKAMTRLKERVWKVYKLNYEAMKAIMNLPANTIPIRPEISNPLHKSRRIRDRQGDVAPGTRLCGIFPRSNFLGLPQITIGSEHQLVLRLDGKNTARFWK
jgi:hypothetical protein